MDVDVEGASVRVAGAGERGVSGAVAGGDAGDVPYALWEVLSESRLGGTEGRLGDDGSGGREANGR